MPSNSAPARGAGPAWIGDALDRRLSPHDRSPLVGERRPLAHSARSGGPALVSQVAPVAGSAATNSGSDLATRGGGDACRARAVVRVCRGRSCARATTYNVSKHFRVLRDVGLLQVEKSGRRRLYALADASSHRR